MNILTNPIEPGRYGPTCSMRADKCILRMHTITASQHNGRAYTRAGQVSDSTCCTLKTCSHPQYAVTWVACDHCYSWFHCICAFMELDLLESDFVCDSYSTVKWTYLHSCVDLSGIESTLLTNNWGYYPSHLIYSCIHDSGQILLQSGVLVQPGAHLLVEHRLRYHLWNNSIWGWSEGKKKGTTL